MILAICSVMKSRLVDPVHIFDNAGRSMLRLNFLEERVKLLEIQLRRAHQVLRKHRDREAPPDQPTTFH